MRSSVKSVVAAVLLCQLMTSSVHACSVPMGWRTLSIDDRLYDADLVVYARAVSIQNDTASNWNSNGYILLNTEVQCVLKNTQNLTVPGTVSIAQGDPPLCTNHLWNVEVGDTYLIMLTPPSQGEDDFYGGAYTFNGVNVQGAAAKIDISTLMNRCDFAGVSLPSSPPAGASCPAVDDSEPCVAGATQLSKRSTQFFLLTTTFVALFVRFVMTR